MKEAYEFRLFPNPGAIIVGESLAKGRVAVVVRGSVGDEKYVQIEQLHRSLKERGEAGAFAGWLLSRTFSAKEKDKAIAFWLDPPIQNSSLEESGTAYDEQEGCSECGIGSVPVAPIVTQTECFRGQDLVRLLSGELLISEKFLNVLRDAECTGFDVLPVAEPILGSKDKKTPTRYWLLSVRNLVPIDRGSTRFGSDPFDLEERGSCKCVAGEVAGYAPLSALRISGVFAEDLALSDVYVGTRRGLLRPYRLLLLSRRILLLLQRANLRGLRTEPVL